MAGNHALSGAVVSLSASAAAPQVGLHLPPLTVALLAVISAGAAVIPDIDHRNSTAARSMGPITRFLSWIVSRTSDKVRDWTCPCCRTDGSDGHRTLTHTGVFAIATGVGVSLAGNRWGLTATAITVGITVGLAGLGLGALVDVRDRDLTGILLGVGAGLAVWQFGGGMDWWWLGIPVGVGTFVHAVGDGLTKQKAPWAWPLKIDGCRWYPCGLPDWLTFRTNGKAERRLVRPALVLAGLVAVGAMVWDPWLAPAWDAGREAYAAVAA